MSSKHLYLVDGHALAYRAFFAMMRSNLTNHDGQPTGALYGFALYLLKLLQEYECPYIAVAFEGTKPTFRNELYAGYKANRETMPEEMAVQMPLIKRLIELFNIPVLSREGLEADDILASLTRTAQHAGFVITLVSKDKDLMQLVNENVRMLLPDGNGKLAEIGREDVAEKMGVPPEQIRDLIALMGDSSDNIPGVPGIGPKTAARLLLQAGSLQKILDNLAAIDNPKLREKIEDNIGRLEISRDLASLRYDAELDIALEDLKRRPIRQDASIAFFKEMDFQSLLDNPMFDVKKHLACTVSKPVNLQEVYEYVAKIKNSGFVSLATETAGDGIREAGLVGIALAWAEDSAAYIPVGHNASEDSHANLHLRDTLMVLKEILESGHIVKLGHNLKYCYQVFKNYGLSLKGLGFDTGVAAYLVNPGIRRYGLDALATEYLSIKAIPRDSLVGKGKNKQPFSSIGISEAAAFAGECVILPLMLKKKLESELDDRDLLKLFTEIEMPLVTVLADIEWYGISLNTELLAGFSRELHFRLDAYAGDIYAMAGEQFNLNSPKQVSEILYSKLNLPRPRKTATGASTGFDALERLSPNYPIAQKMLEYRELQKLLSTYIDALPQSVSPKTGRIHTTFSQKITATGRLASAHPNLQNIPVRTREGNRIRDAFRAAAGCKLIAADYSQIELRILAHCSTDHLMIRAFQDDQDIHTQTAYAIYGVMPEMITPEMRRTAKAINFGLMYGMGSASLSRRLSIGIKEAQNFIEAYFQQFPTIKTFINRTVDRAKVYGYTETLLGRRRYVPEINSKSRQLREAAERIAINTPIQGTAADIIKIAMIAIQREAAKSFAQAKMLLQVHDELVCEAPQNEASVFAEWLQIKMAEAYKLKVPLKVDVTVGETWNALH
ncbi:MAG: DNA polymerase I [Chitinivibrionales bacterium]|nr:DNA polymerase I [Chitinivibrionales bacterium]